MNFEGFLNAKKCFKLILGAGNEDCSKITELTEIYSLAGCKFFDINSSMNAYNALKKGLELSKKEGFICISTGVIGDIHFKKCKIDEFLCKKCEKCHKVCLQGAISNFQIDEKKCVGCLKCFDDCKNNAIKTYTKQNFDSELFNLVDCIEFHISSDNHDEIFSKWKYLTSNFNGFLSVCLNRKFFSDVKMIEILNELFKIRNEKIIIQADGNPMTGANGFDNLSSLQALACFDLINKNFKNIPIFLSGGVNFKTRSLADFFNLDVTGFSFGSYARKIVSNGKSKEEKVEIAKNLINEVVK